MRKEVKMEIRWPNLITFVIVICVLVMALKNHHQIAAFLSTMKAIGPGHDPDEQVLGLIAFGILMVSIVALTVILKDNRRNQ